MVLTRKAEAIKEDFKSFEELGLLNFSSFNGFMEEFKMLMEDEEHSDFIKVIKKVLPQLEKFSPEEEEKEEYEEVKAQLEEIVKKDKEFKSLHEGLRLLEKTKIFNPKSPFSDIFTHSINNLTYEEIINFELITFLNTLFTEFDNYLFQTFKFLILKNPKKLDKKKVSLEDLNLLGDLNKDLINDLAAENTLHDLFYNSYEQVFKYAKNFFNLKLIIPEKDIVMLMIYKQIRNIYTHGDGTANLLFIKKIRRYGCRINFHTYNALKIGDKIKVTKNIITDLNQLTGDICGVIDKALLEQYPELKISVGIRLGKKKKKKIEETKGTIWNRI